MCIWRAEDNLQELVYSFNYVGLRNGTQVLGIGTPDLSLHHLVSPESFFFSVYKCS